MSQGAMPADRLTREIGLPRTEWTADRLVRWVSDAGIHIVSLMHIAGDGQLKTLDFVPGSESHLRDILQAGERADGSSLFPELAIPAEASDVLLRPRLATAFVDPFSPTPTLAILCGHASREGTPLPESPDTIVRAAHARLQAEAGTELHALTEVEYFLGGPSVASASACRSDCGYHATSPMVLGQSLRREALSILAEMGIAVKYGHSEVGYIPAGRRDERVWEQHEIELGLAPLPQAADAAVLTQWVLRNLAEQHGLVCSFEPVLHEGHAGSGLHVHLSPVVDGQPLGGRTAEGELHPPATWLIAGLVQLGGALMAFGNREASSFVRLRQAKEAPNAVNWGDHDRKALVRLPILVTTPAGAVVGAPTIEFRLPDGSAHPHLLLAGIAQAMLYGRATEGIAELLRRTASSSMSEQPGHAAAVPGDFQEVADALDAHRSVLEQGGVFPVHVLDHVVSTLRA